MNPISSTRRGIAATLFVPVFVLAAMAPVLPAEQDAEQSEPTPLVLQAQPVTPGVPPPVPFLEER